jgi:hypothetical protein
MQIENQQSLQAQNDSLSLDSLLQRILARESSIDEGRLATASAAVRTVQVVIEQGKDLLAAKEQLPHGKFLPWLAENFPKSQRTAYNYMSVASKFAIIANLDDAKFQLELFKAAGLLPEVSQSPKQPGISLPPIIQRLNYVAEWATKEAYDIETWQPAQREAMKQRLLPVVEIYNKL